MKIWAYVLLNEDDLDVAANCLNSLARSNVSRIIIVDGGTEVALIHHQRNFTPVETWLNTRDEWRFPSGWSGTPLHIITHPWIAPGEQRNFILEWIATQPDKPDFIVALDSDEVFSTEAEQGLRPYLESLPEGVTNVVQPILTLVQDEQHGAAGNHSAYLSHSRICRPGTVSYTNGYHEHQNYTGQRARWDARIIHTRMLFRRRLYLQRNAPTLKGAWRDVEMTDVPSDVHWTPLEWPRDERIIPFESDARDFYEQLG